MIKAQFERLTPKQKKMAALGGAAIVVIAGISMFSSPKVEEKKEDPYKIIRSVLTDSDTRSVGIESLAAKIKTTEKENQNLTREITQLRREMTELRDATKTSKQLTQDVETMLAMLKENKREITETEKRFTQALDEYGNPVESLLDEDETDQLPINGNPMEPTASGIPPGNTIPAPVIPTRETGSRQVASNKSNDNDAAVTVDDVFKKPAASSRNHYETVTSSDAGYAVADVGVVDSNGKPLPAGKPGKTATDDKKGLVIVSRSLPEKEPTSEEVAQKDKDSAFYLPAGSIISGVLINGMDAPAGPNAQSDPFPSIVRIQKEAILPNRFRADIRECFLIISGYGDLSSERGLLRGETLSCVRENGDVIESALPSYAIGEDGKAGIRGRLVSKSGQIIAKSLQAGFLSAAASMFDVSVVPTISTSSSGTVNYDSILSKQAIQGAAASGASNALDRIAEYYISMAEGMFPVIEIDAGRRVDIVVSKGTKLPVTSKGSDMAITGM